MYQFPLHESAYQALCQRLRQAPRTWLVTGVAGFIGSNLLETLLSLDQNVVGLDNFSTGYQRNLDETCAQVTARQWANFRFIEGDIQNAETCIDACKGVDHVLHQAALGSVPQSLMDPIASNAINVGGFLNMLVAARDAKVRTFIYAASSSTYGDNAQLPKVEEHIGRPLSPYAVTKYVNELYSDVFARCYGVDNIGLRYFNVFGRRQDPAGAYAAVIPQWTSDLINEDPIFINGDGETTRDFCFVGDVVQANLLAATTTERNALNQIYNVGSGVSTTLNGLFRTIRTQLAANRPDLADAEPVYRAFREGDIRHSVADIGKARLGLGFDPKYLVEDGLEIAIPWYETLEATA